MASSLYFAHVTDVHLSAPGDPWTGEDEKHEPRLLRETFDTLNRMDDLDFVLLTGDVLDRATPEELDLFLDIFKHLRKPWHFVPGNHDGYIHESNPLALTPKEVVSAIDPRLIDYTPDANNSFWSREVKPGIQVIGLDSRLANDWSGEIRPQQLDWLRRELDKCSYQDLVIIAVHHPVHKLGPHNEREWWNKFVLSNGRPVERLFDIYPNVQLVLSGHHHCNHITIRNQRMHLVTAPLTMYPCNFRTIRMKHTPDGWHTHIETHIAADPDTLDMTQQTLLNSTSARNFDPFDPHAWLMFCVGTEKDQEFEGMIEGEMR